MEESVEAWLELVRVVVQFCFMFTDFTLQCIGTWYSNWHRQKKPPPTASKPILNLAGKGSHKKPPLQKWQAFSSLYYHPRDSPLHVEVQSLYDQCYDPSAVEFLSEFLPPDTDITTTDCLTFFCTYSRECCTRLSSEEKEKVQVYIESQQLLAAERQDCPWFLDHNYEDKHLLGGNRYIQQ